MKRILFSASWFETDQTGTSRPRFEAGQHYSPDDVEAQRCVARGIAAEVDVADEPVTGDVVIDADKPAVDAAPAAPAPAKAKK